MTRCDRCDKQTASRLLRTYIYGSCLSHLSHPVTHTDHIIRFIRHIKGIPEG
jgi:hypothetical protein